jgi:DNA invertase Pin-like site-specific DNA recombinase
LRGRAVALGWRDDQIIVIDNDQGESGASAAWREGFQRLVTDVGMGQAGIVMGLEVSRLARNNADWHRLLEICAVSTTELHILKARLRGGILNKVRRGEYRCPLPTGFVYDELQLSCSTPTHKSGKRSPTASKRSRA